MADDCSICWETLKDPVSFVPCGHTYCFECAVVWLRKEKRCGTCRAPVSDCMLAVQVRKLQEALVAERKARGEDADVPDAPQRSHQELRNALDGLGFRDLNMIPAAYHEPLIGRAMSLSVEGQDDETIQLLSAKFDAKPDAAHLAEAIRRAEDVGVLSLVKRLVDQGASVNGAGSPERPLHEAVDLACETGCLDVAKFLLERRADPNQRLPHGAVPLEMAVCAHYPALVRLLMIAGANPYIPSLERTLGGERLAPFQMAYREFHHHILNACVARQDVGGGSTPSSCELCGVFSDLVSNFVEPSEVGLAESPTSDDEDSASDLEQELGHGTFGHCFVELMSHPFTLLGQEPSLSSSASSSQQPSHFDLVKRLRGNSRKNLKRIRATTGCNVKLTMQILSRKHTQEVEDASQFPKSGSNLAAIRVRLIRPCYWPGAREKGEFLQSRTFMTIMRACHMLDECVKQCADAYNAFCQEGDRASSTKNFLSFNPKCSFSKVKLPWEVDSLGLARRCSQCESPSTTPSSSSSNSISLPSPPTVADLPTGWHRCVDTATGKYVYYNDSGHAQWAKPVQVDYFLPFEIDGSRNLQRKGDGYVVENGPLHSTSEGVPYHNSKSTVDKSGRPGPGRGDTVHGAVEESEDGLKWLKVKVGVQATSPLLAGGGDAVSNKAAELKALQQQKDALVAVRDSLRAAKAQSQPASLQAHPIDFGPLNPQQSMLQEFYVIQVQLDDAKAELRAAQELFGEFEFQEETRLADLAESQMKSSATSLVIRTSSCRARAFESVVLAQRETQQLERRWIDLKNRIAQEHVDPANGGQAGFVVQFEDRDKWPTCLCELNNVAAAKGLRLDKSVAPRVSDSLGDVIQCPGELAVLAKDKFPVNFSFTTKKATDALSEAENAVNAALHEDVRDKGVQPSPAPGSALAIAQAREAASSSSATPRLPNWMDQVSMMHQSAAGSSSSSSTGIATGSNASSSSSSVMDLQALLDTRASWGSSTSSSSSSAFGNNANKGSCSDSWPGSGVAHSFLHGVPSLSLEPNGSFASNSPGFHSEATPLPPVCVPTNITPMSMAFPQSGMVQLPPSTMAFPTPQLATATPIPERGFVQTASGPVVRPVDDGIESADQPPPAKRSRGDATFDAN